MKFYFCNFDYNFEELEDLDRYYNYKNKENKENKEEDIEENPYKIEYYCKACHEPKYSQILKCNLPSMWYKVEKKTLKDIINSYPNSKKPFPTKELDRMFCFNCWQTKTKEELIQKKVPDLVLYRINRKKKLLKDYKIKKSLELQKSKPKTEEEKDKFLEEGWVGPTVRTCDRAPCDSNTCYIQIRSPLSDDEPPMVIYKCAKCLKTNLDYK